MGLCKRILTIPCFIIFHGSLFSVGAHAEDSTRYEFDNAILMGNASLNDLQSFNAAGLLHRTYIVDIYINDNWRGRRELLFKKDNHGDLVSCYSEAFLKGVGINPENESNAGSSPFTLRQHCRLGHQRESNGETQHQPA